ncbi:MULTISPECIES: FadR/GntR family transcriptional regulator [unclassified Chelatococcus]|jgi:GntR family transcriptional repressor for pyruvate dehydrogenase complex|uniref:FadR/GntR family transcriptional regulator n=1 Tax=unclassified Chelatococcus TaxID=2638111 RepID=UPI001BCBFE4E|nr:MULTISPECIES: FadR/GntR family transcriptional regulator [unclassified Chelatococcus]CAH1650411.1 GntR family transcriptional regulator [Hyphomicrobiales bacterium]MBS7739729.1 FadR family transcriptional regulator [Chelatococcus sp. HY11]MBX3544098.1 FadR family transcriptional regulator [Chelatococcus sp.]MCO5075735.1 FadR family transcriptional regulator [Chelatococcus sp.]CAH1666335.1 GntR family transcriptional regulator [Hyphomicrobiales bacterium]
MLETSTTTNDKQRLTETVTQFIIDRVSQKVFRPGDSLPSEADLARQLNVSKPVVREALGRLAALGIVQIQQGKPTTIQGLTVAPLDQFLRLAVRTIDNGLREAIELRRAVETEIAALAAERATPLQIEQVEIALDKMKRNIDGSLEQWLQADFAFHVALARCSDNTLFEHFMEALGDTIRFTQRALGLQRDLRDPAATFARHEAIVDALKAKDPAAARAAMITHFAFTDAVVAEIARDHRRLDRF